ncbi:IclR family transcriptional regulator [Shimia thalassica]|uniref:IclR family transcriptional regulator n=1 Tax=Shimia thalassica TaxID=1715693 RepID=UPI0026E45CAE|nr:helix-turn-helix domain-containing protein [Shimia thalassica]MDO6483235.1 helix-turn-helix domain-containing protein [Shimia thalassica]
MSTLKTLDRGLRALDIVSRRADGISVADLALDLEVDRAVAYRIVATLEQHGMILRLPQDGKLVLGAAVLGLERRFEPQFRRRARPLLDQLARQAHATAFISVAQQDKCAAILVSEPEDVLIRVGYRVGSTHAISKGAAGIAILAGRPPADGEPPEVTQARTSGYSLTKGALQQGAIGVACPIGGGTYEASVGVVAMEDLDVDRAIDTVKACAKALSALLTGTAQVTRDTV